MQQLLRDEILLAAFAILAILESIYKSPWLYLAAAIPMITFLVRTRQWLRKEQAEIDRSRAELDKMIAEMNLKLEAQDDRPD
jgi:hypothetical protein